MATIMTNYTTYDLRYYYADTKRLPRLSKEEEYTLIASLAAPTSPSLSAQQMAQVKQRLIEGHLGLATCIAADLCPRRCRDLYPDLVQEANLALIQATNRCDYSSSGNFTAYVAAWMRGRVKQALADDSLIKIGYDARQRVLQGGGTLDEVRALQHPLSLDCLLDEHDPDSSLLDSLEVPSQPTTPVCDPHTHEQVERQARQARLEEAYAQLEAAGKSPSERVLARAAQVDKMTALRFLRAHHAELALSRRAEQCARRARLEEAYRRLEAAGKPFSGRALAREAQVALSTAQHFLRKPVECHA